MKELQYISHALGDALSETMSPEIRGRVVQVVGTIIKAVGVNMKIGEIAILRNTKENWELQAEVVGFSENALLLTPLGKITGLSSSIEVVATGKHHQVPVGNKLLGRILDGLGHPMDGDFKGELEIEDYYPVYADPPHALLRKIITKPISLGVRAIDGLLTCCEGQRMGIFSAAGVGKSSLLGMLTRGADVDVIVLAMIGERGREVREFIEDNLGAEGLKKSVVVVSTSDRPPLERLKAAYVATAIAEYFRDQNQKVLLLVDSVTRFARAQRDLGLATGEPPTRRGFPPSVFSALPMVMERAGQSDKGSITALYTVLVEGDDMSEPVADETRSILDGHIVLSRDLAAANHYPAIDILESVSRVMNNAIEDRHHAAASKFRALLAKYNEIELLVRIGEYQSGSDPEADEALTKIERINAFLRQGNETRISFEQTVEQLIGIVTS